MARRGASRIQTPCDACKRYLDHLDEKNKNVRSFLSPMTASSKHSMVVPKRFLKHFAGKLSGTIKLDSPNRGSYDVEVTEHCNKVVFRHGWRQFVESHDIKENDYLLFRHVEGSCFEVLIFDTDGCEKMFSCAGIRSVDYVNISSDCHHETTESSASERFVRCQKGSSCHHGKIAKKVAAFSSSESGEDIPSENKSSESDDLQTPLRQHYVLSRRNYLSKAQEERVIALIQEIQPESTAFVAVMRKSHVQPPCPYLVISKGYALAHFPHKSTNVTLQTPGKSKKWHPKFYKRKDGQLYMLKEQWMDFVRDNHVQEGDICLFLPTMAGRRSTFTVYLIQATSTCSRGGSGKRGSLSHQKEIAKKAAVSSLYEESAGEDSLSGYESIQSDHVKAFSECNYVLSARCHLTVEQEKKIVGLFKKVQPEIPFLVIQMKKSNVNHLRSDLVICKRYAAQHFPEESQSITLERQGGKKWRSKLHVRPDGSGYLLTTGWQNFVRDNHLQEDDICLFQPMPSKKGFRVMVHLLHDPSTRSSSSGGHAHGLNSHVKRRVTSTAHVHEKSGSENSGSLDLHKCRSVQQVHQVFSDCEVVPSSSMPPLYVVLGGTCLTPAQDKVVQEKAMAIKAEVSIFVATMNDKIVGYHYEPVILDLSDAAQYLPDGKQSLTLRQQGKAWHTNLHNRLMLATGEWHQFVRDNGLEDRDICLFEPMKNERLAMLVHIIRSQQYS
ncbi:B3 domain-containing protein Os03g0619600 isoform X1 [Sorghum bicolor]|uniref:B3 domain-containing protein Os03g0619600 isoform X1 n=1 Tax=Sorghum bicolor TaxID=4558 RepID=UPI000B4261E3|nr:B3 domain-containing protein Os03g0619600 isoform X1 [Sorghum bicolor]XP_021318279.1 B3 domain-containing protein Os03g0619600 isoform X1 [Sorghum bicolor]|eukprot:XP_021318275.1 B3 domain-containing protein Os03g0619600 isoform X1 [Sorghum bicolor]